MVLPPLLAPARPLLSPVMAPLSPSPVAQFSRPQTPQQHRSRPSKDVSLLSTCSNSPVVDLPVLNPANQSSLDWKWVHNLDVQDFKTECAEQAKTNASESKDLKKELEKYCAQRRQKLKDIQVARSVALAERYRSKAERVIEGLEEMGKMVDGKKVREQFQLSFK